MKKTLFTALIIFSFIALGGLILLENNSPLVANAEINENTPIVEHLTENKMLDISRQLVKKEAHFFQLKDEKDYKQWLKEMFIEPKNVLDNYEILEYNAYSDIEIEFQNEKVLELSNNTIMYTAKITQTGIYNPTDEFHLGMWDLTYIIKDVGNNQYKILNLEKLFYD